MVSIEEALQIVDSQEVKLNTRELALALAQGCYLAQSISAPFDMPSFDNSAMDGYAICGAGQAFEIVGEIAAGDIAEKALKAGQAMRIFTGGKVPTNATAVVMQEKTAVERITLHVQEEVRPGQNIRRRGVELKTGQAVFEPGQLLNPAALGMIASLGVEQVKVYQKPSIRLITTGNELIAPGQPRREGQIYESNSFALMAAMHDQGFYCEGKTHIRDDYEATEQGIADALANCEVLILSGGISVGDYDYVKPALEANGVEELYYKVLQKPGKPLYFGRKGNQFVFALPGNPASSLTCFYIHVLPLLQKLSGAQESGLPRISLPLAEGYEFRFKRPTFLKAHIRSGEVRILDGQGSNMIHSMALGNALVFLEEPGKYEVGEAVICILF